MSIPRKIHFVWVGPPMPEWAKRNVEEFRRLNPDHEVAVHGRDALHPDYEAVVGNCKDPCEVADLIRYSVLEAHGGWYFDADYWPFRPVADVERAYALDGEQIFVAEVWASRDNPGWLGNAVLASRAGHPFWPRLRARALEAVPEGRLTYGPRLIRRMLEEDPAGFILAPEPWFNGPKPEWSGRLYRAIQARGDAKIMRTFDPRTGGQVPIAMHLWAWKYGQEIDRPPEKAPRARVGTYGRGNPRHAAVLTLPGYKFDLWPSLFTGAGRGLAALGFEVEMMAMDSKAFRATSELPDVMVAWNGLREPAQAVIAEARRFGTKVLLMEMGFWQRQRYTQVDHQGTQHRASWASRLRRPAPPEGAARLAKFYPNGLTPVHPRKSGYILVLGQVPLDTQLNDSEIKGPLPLQKAVRGAVPEGVPVYFRPHPLCANVRVHGTKVVLPVLEGGGASEASAYRSQKAGPGLAEALSGARFVILINSTAGNEALAAGVPVLALGPALYLSAGVARQATVRTMRADIRAMLDGWAPDQAQVENYLRWLAARQWSPEELAEGTALRTVLAEAGIYVLEPERPEPEPEFDPEVQEVTA